MLQCFGTVFDASICSECGSAFTSKLEGMFTDVNISKELMTEFKQSEHAQQCPVDLSASILTTGTWPNFTAVDVNLPSIVSFIIQKESVRCLILLSSLFKDKKLSKVSIIKSTMEES